MLKKEKFSRNLNVACSMHLKKKCIKTFEFFNTYSSALYLWLNVAYKKLLLLLLVLKFFLFFPPYETNIYMCCPGNIHTFSLSTATCMSNWRIYGLFNFMFLYFVLSYKHTYKDTEKERGRDSYRYWCSHSNNFNNCINHRVLIVITNK